MPRDRYPLSWPTGWKRTPPGERLRATFSKNEPRTAAAPGDVVRPRRTTQLNAVDAAERLEYQIDKLGGSEAILSTNQALRLDGRPRANSEPLDPGAAVYFRLHGKDHVLACDKWDRVADNIAAIAAHIDAIRRIDRYGVGNLEQAFAGYQALPAKGATWRTTLGFAPDQTVTRAAIDDAFRERAREAHPDRPGGSHDAMASLTAARTEGYAEAGP